jgi:hypothetical protein
MKIHDIKGVYMATDSAEDQVVAKFRARLPNFHRGNVESKTLSTLLTDCFIISKLILFVLVDMEENYYRSLVEQEIMMRSKYFLGSYYSTWSVAVWMVPSFSSSLCHLCSLIYLYIGSGGKRSQSTRIARCGSKIS